ncbi:Sulfiredoxin [Nakaseomyces bracarensis]|uniref:sulfiredoxin n=1 Tax=Nakaseomyces bracarensis TaxID=273131 RepID=A0ABR4NR43_9SACH
MREGFREHFISNDGNLNWVQLRGSSNLTDKHYIRGLYIFLIEYCLFSCYYLQTGKIEVNTNSLKNKITMSMQSSNLRKVSQIPLSQIRRPIAPVLDYQKIDAMVSTMKGVPQASRTCSLEAATEMNGELPPIDVLCVRENGENYYFAFGGCHRFQAYDRLAQEQNNPDVPVRAKVLPSTRHQLRLYVGTSIDTMFEEVDKLKKQEEIQT